MDLRRLEASGDRAGQLRELLRRGREEEARALAWGFIRAGEPYEVVDADGRAKPVFRYEDGGWSGEFMVRPRWVCVCGARVPALWTSPRARLFACDVAMAALPDFEKLYPEDQRPRQAIEVARRFAYGLATGTELWTARRAAVEASAVGEVCAARAVSVASSAASAWGSETGWLAAEEVASKRWSAAPLGAEGRYFRGKIALLFMRWHLGEVPEYME